MAVISRAFLEIGATYDGLKKGLEEAVRVAEANGAKLSSAGKKMVQDFENALNPTKQLATQLEALQKAGYSAAEIQSVLGSKIEATTRIARAHGQAIEPIVEQYRSLELRLKNAGESMTNVGKNMSMFVTAPLVAGGVAAIKVAAEYEQVSIAFSTLLGSAQKAGAYLAELADFAKKTPFEFKDLVEASKRMMALGFEAKQIIPIMRTIGDAVAALGGGTELINRITLALGQMQAKGKVSAEEMRQLAEAGIPAWDALASKIGLSIPQAMKQAERGVISASVAIPAILASMDERFSGMMEKQSQTLLGQLSNMKDQLYFALKDFGEKMIPAAKGVLEGLQPIITSLGEIAQGFGELNPSIQSTILATTAFVAAAGPVIYVVGNITKAFAALIPYLAGVTGAILGGAGLGVALGVLIDKLDLFGTSAAIGADAVLHQANTYRQAAIDGGAYQKVLDDHKAMLDAGIISQKTLDGILHDTFDRRLTESAEQYRDRMIAMAAQYETTAVAAEKANVPIKKTGAILEDVEARLKRTHDAAMKYMKPVDQMFQFLSRDIGFETDALIKNAEAIDKAAKARSDSTSELDRFKPQVWDATDAIDDLNKRVDAQKKSWERLPPEMRNVKTSQEQVADSMKKQVSTALTNMAQSLANNIVEWKGWAETLTSIMKNLAKGLLSIVLEDLLGRLTGALFGKQGSAGGGIFGSIISGITGLFTGKGGGSSGGIGGAIGGIGGAVSGAGGGGGITGGILGALKGQGGIIGAAGAGLGAIGIGGGAASAGVGATTMPGIAAASGVQTAGAGGISGALGLGGGSGMFGLGAATIPVIGGIIAGGIFGGKALAKWAAGSDAYNVMQEKMMDMGLDNVPYDAIKQWTQQAGIGESDLYSRTYYVAISPRFISDLVYPAAQQKGNWGNVVAYLNKQIGGTPGYGDTISNAISANSVDWADWANEKYMQGYGMAVWDQFKPGWEDQFLFMGKAGGDKIRAKLGMAPSAGAGGGAGWAEGAPSPYGNDVGWPPPKFETGIGYVPQNMLAYLHKGERVVPASQNSGQINIHIGNVFGVQDLKDQLYSVFTDLRSRGLVLA